MHRATRHTRPPRQQEVVSGEMERFASVQRESTTKKTKPVNNVSLQRITNYPTLLYTGHLMLSENCAALSGSLNVTWSMHGGVLKSAGLDPSTAQRCDPSSTRRYTWPCRLVNTIWPPTAIDHLGGSPVQEVAPSNSNCSRDDGGLADSNSVAFIHYRWPTRTPGCLTPTGFLPHTSCVPSKVTDSFQRSLVASIYCVEVQR